MSPTAIAGYLALFGIVGFVFVFISLLAGRFLRPRHPHAEKLEVYECGEPTIGSSFVQFDLRFYVIALLFIIFDVEVAFFFPWATVFGKATHVMDPNVAVEGGADPATWNPRLQAVLAEMDVPPEALAVSEGDFAAATPAAQAAGLRETAQDLAFFTIADILVFFGVLMVGFAYVWYRGDLDWVRAIGQGQAAAPLGQAGGAAKSAEPALAGQVA
jgi:NADH-quinone oxidoreductase subunit A